MQWARPNGESGKLPLAIIIHPSLAAEARQACAALELTTPVKADGGCLAFELWLEVEQ